MKYDPISRRHFLRGAGGFLLSLPVLPSLLSPREAEAACLSIPTRLMTIDLEYGNIADHNFYPSHSQMNLQSSALLPGHAYRWGALPTTEISPCFGSQFNAFHDQMTFVRGIDIPQGAGHGEGNMFGSGLNAGSEIPRCATIDQVMADYYQAQAPTPTRSIVYGGDGPSLRRTATGGVEAVSPVHSARELFDQMFGTSGGGSSQTLVVDRVLQDYQNARNNSRLDQDGRDKLTQVMDTLSDLQQRLNQSVSCNSNPTEPPWLQTWHNTDNQRQDWQNIADVTAAGFLCCVTNVGAVRLHRYQHPGWNDWHDNSHDSANPTSQNIILGIIRFQIENFLLPLMQRFSQIIEPNGRSLLYNSLIILGQELAQPNDHSNTGTPLMFAGNAGGRIRSGYFDYRNMTTQYMLGSTMSGEANRLGIPLTWLLMSTLQACGLSPSQARAGLPQHSAYMSGYGANVNEGVEWIPGPDQYNHPFFTQHELFTNYYSPMFSHGNDLLPHQVV